MTRAVWLTFTVAISAIVATISSAQTNSYISATDGFWDEARLWSLAAPPSITQSGIFITNAASVNVTIDSITASEFPETLTISNLTISAPSNVTNTLFLQNTGSIALQILSDLDIESGGSLVSTNSTLSVAGSLTDNGMVVFSGGDSLFLTNGTLTVGGLVDGVFIMSNGIVHANEVLIGPPVGGGASGTLSFSGGTMIVDGILGISAGSPNFNGFMFVSDGGLVVATNGATLIGNVLAGENAAGSLVVTNATFLGNDVWVGNGYRGSGALTVDDGTVTLNGYLNIGSGDNFGSVTLDGGLLSVTQGDTYIGATDYAPASLQVSDGLFHLRNLFVGIFVNSSGSLNINGGIVQVSSNLQAGAGFAEISVSDGQLIVTNGLTTLDGQPSAPIHYGGPVGTVYPPQITVSGGQFSAKTIALARNGNTFNDGSMLIVTGATANVSDGITLGICGSNMLGYVVVNGGQLTVTNSFGSGFIDVQHGQLVMDNGVLQVDTLVMTNTCSQFLHTGGTLIVGRVILDPNEFQIVSVARQSNDVLVSWLMAPGATNALQAATGGSGYSTNGFTDIFVVTNNTSAGVLTNYLDVGGATNKSRYYRAKLVL